MPSPGCCILEGK
jgi:hypothetical protein